MTASTTPTPSPAPTGAVELDVTGMTCASCANRIERKLNKLDGVTATAKVSYPPDMVPDALMVTVEQAGYGASIHKPAGAPAESGEAVPDAGDAALHALRHRLWVSIALTVPVIAMAMIPPLQFDNWQWLSLTLAAPVVIWGGWQFHRAAWVNLKHGTSTMDTLISLGTLAALGCSVYALFWGTAGQPGMRHEF